MLLRIILVGCLGLAIAGLSFAPRANACTPLRYVDEVSYADGDLAEQIVSRAHTIQIVEVRARYLLARYDTRAELFWQTGRWRPDGPAVSRYREIYVFEMEAVETLKGGAAENMPIRARALALGDDPTLWQSLGAMVGMILDAPSRDGMVIRPVAVDPYSATSCSSALALREGDRYLILRDERGNILTPTYEDGEWRNALPISLRNEGNGETFDIQAPGMMEVSPATSEFIARIRAALQAN